MFVCGLFMQLHKRDLVYIWHHSGLILNQILHVMSQRTLRINLELHPILWTFPKKARIAP
jgi:hypothetical protein